LSLWLARFPEPKPEHFVFPSHRPGFENKSRKSNLCGIDPTRPMGTWSYKRSFDTAKAKAGVTYRFYDARHSCAPSMARDLEVKVLCASRPRRALAKRKGVIVRWGPKEAWSKAASRRTGTGYKTW